MEAPVANPPPADQALQQATQLAQHGYRVLPIRPGKKQPPMASWQHAATTNPQTIRNWWNGLYRDHGIGIATGHLEDGTPMFVLDIDERDNYSGADTIRQLEQQHAPLPVTITQITGSGSRHHFYTTPPGWPTPRNSQSGTLGPGLDIRGEGGQVVVPPSTHPNGNTYRWVDGQAPGQTDLAQAPTWLMQMLTPAPAPPPTPTPTPTPNRHQPPDTTPSPADHYNNTTTWEQLLTRDGWTHTKTNHDQTQHWTRPGKQPGDGTSATVGWQGLDILHIFTSSVPHLQPDRSYSRFQYEAHTHWNSDYRALAQHINRQNPNRHPPITTGAPQNTPTHTDTPGTAETNQEQQNHLQEMLLDWDRFWTQDNAEPTWLLEPVIPDNRSTAIFAPGGTGKSLFALYLATTIATGNVGLDGTTPTPQRHVLYLDYEMSQDDLQERLIAMGHTPNTDLSHLHYALLPHLPPADDPEGGKAILQLAEMCNADLVIIDTFGRAVSGDENEADTVRNFYRWTGIHLKAARRAFIRIDHAGKNLEKGQRGTSAKNDDVDLVWQLHKTENGIRLTARKRRMGWIPETLDLDQHDQPELRYRLTNQPTPRGTQKTIDDLDQLQIDPNSSGREAAQALRQAGKTARNDVIRAAQRIRKQQQNQPGRTPGRVPETDAPNPNGAHQGAPHPTPGQNTGRGVGRVGAHPPDATWAHPPTLVGGATSEPHQQELDDQWF